MHASSRALVRGTTGAAGVAGVVSVRVAALVAVLAGAMGSSSVARAQATCAATTCPTGFQCEIQPTPCPAIACIPGDACTPCTGQTAVCVPSTCSADADCGPQMVCAQYQTTECPTAPPTTTAPCPSGTDCSSTGARAAPLLPVPPSCTQKVIQRCTPRWQLPCRVAADCGAGFTCEQQQSCTCSGSGGGATPGTMGSAPGGSGGGTPSSGGGAADPATGGGSAPALVAPDAGAPSCTCTPSGVYACVAAVRACMAATDCPADWTCRDNPDGACWRSSDGDGGCLPADPPKVCAPPYSDLPGIGGVPTRGTTGTTNPPGATPGGENTGSSAGRSSGCSMAGRALGGPGDWLAALGLLGLGVRHLRRLRPRRR